MIYVVLVVWGGIYFYWFFGEVVLVGIVVGVIFGLVMVLDIEFNVKRNFGFDEYFMGWNIVCFVFLINVGVVIFVIFLEKFVVFVVKFVAIA